MTRKKRHRKRRKKHRQRLEGKPLEQTNHGDDAQNERASHQREANEVLDPMTPPVRKGFWPAIRDYYLRLIHGEASFEDVEILFSAVVAAAALVGVGGVLVTYLSLQETRNSVAITRTQLRAWVGVSGTEAIAFVPIIERNTVRLRVPIANTGQTPAFNVRVKAVAIAHPVNDPEPIQILAKVTEPPDNRGTVFPQATIGHHADGLWDDVDSVLKEIRGGTKLTYVIGRITYDTVNPNEKGDTQFCIFLIFKTLTEHTQQACSTFNDAK